MRLAACPRASVGANQARGLSAVAAPRLSSWCKPFPEPCPACRRASAHPPRIKPAALSNTAMRASQSAAASAEAPAKAQSLQAKDVVLQYYEFYNASDIDGVMSLMAEDCKYHDMIYSDPFEGKAEIRRYFDKVVSIVPPDLKFHVEEISGGDPHFAGVKWHVDLNGHEFPFSRGVSFYEINDEGKIIAARDCVEPALKPGAAALQGLKVMTPIVRRLGPKANPAVLKDISIKSYLIWAFYAVYCAYVFFSTAAPGQPVYNTPPETWTWILNDSLNFFYVNIFAQWAGLPSIPTPDGNPVSEALFNFVNAWSLMFWPVLLADSKRHRVNRKLLWWTGMMFLTNVFFVPFMALRERLPKSREQRNKESPRNPPSFSRLFGGLSLAIALISTAWLFAGRPDAGGLDARWAFAAEQFSGNRAFWAFVLDLGLYSIWQAVLLKDCGASNKYRFVPFFGLAAWLIARGEPVSKGLKSGFWDPLDTKDG